MAIMEVRVSVRVRVGFICLFIIFSYFLFAYRKIRKVLTGVLRLESWLDIWASW